MAFSDGARQARYTACKQDRGAFRFGLLDRGMHFRRRSISVVRNHHTRCHMISLCSISSFRPISSLRPISLRYHAINKSSTQRARRVLNAKPIKLKIVTTHQIMQLTTQTPPAMMRQKNAAPTLSYYDICLIRHSQPLSFSSSGRLAPRHQPSSLPFIFLAIFTSRSIGIS